MQTITKQCADFFYRRCWVAFLAVNGAASHWDTKTQISFDLHSRGALLLHVFYYTSANGTTEKLTNTAIRQFTITANFRSRRLQSHFKNKQYTSHGDIAESITRVLFAETTLLKIEKCYINGKFSFVLYCCCWQQLYFCAIQIIEDNTRPCFIFSRCGHYYLMQNHSKTV